MPVPIQIPPMPRIEDFNDAVWHQAPHLYRLALEAWERVAKAVISANLQCPS